jgi:Uma2 family endonuclease
MTHETFAPWGELVPDVPPLTAADLARLPDEARGYELVEGRLVRMSPTGGRHSDVAMDLGAALRVFAKSRRLGKVLGAETGFTLSRPGEPDTVLAPDVAFVRADRVPPADSPEYDRYWRLPPDLVVEVASPDQYRPEMAAKARFWLAAGVRLVWVVWPRARQVDVWRPGAAQPTATLGAAATLDGLDVIPGFRYPVAELFR